MEHFGGRALEGNFAVVNVWVDRTDGPHCRYRGAHFEIRTKSGRMLVSQLSLRDLLMGDDPAGPRAFASAGQILWRSDLRFVAGSQLADRRGAVCAVGMISRRAAAGP